MKIQYLAVIFIIIILPISMVISYYVNAQIQTINQQELYDAKLVTATYDSVKSFQLNTLNNKYSSVSDSKIRDIEAGISSFFNSLGTELGATGYSREDLSPFIPAILYSMYDGYYIYGKYYDKGIDNGDGTFGDYRIGLKPYVYYSCRYRDANGANDDFVVNYTLDNTITVYGKVNGNDDVAASGALIQLRNYDQSKELTYTYTYFTSTGNIKSNTVCIGANYKKVNIEREVLSENLIILDDNNMPTTKYPETYEYITYKDQKIYVEKEDGKIKRDNEHKYYKTNPTNAGKHRSQLSSDEIEEYKGVKCFILYKNKKQYITDIETMAFIDAMADEYHVYSNSACQYYYDAYKFSTWVNTQLSGITQKYAKEFDENGSIKEITDFDISTEGNIFNVGSDDPSEDPTLESSTFNQNRISVIERSIKTNLTAEMASFDVNGYEYRMPHFTVEDWDKIVNNMCVTSFMQGMPIRMKYYNNYCVVPNDKNKEVVTEDSIYIITDKDGEVEVHYPGCEDLIDLDDYIVAGYRNIDFERQSVTTYGEPVYYYPHDDQKSYNCMVNAKGTFDLEDIIEEESKIKVGQNLRRIYLTALAREKYDLYRTNGYFGVPVE